MSESRYAGEPWYNDESMKAYTIFDALPDDAVQALAAYPPLVRNLLIRRGITDPETANAFLHPDWERDTHDPFLMKDMDRAVERILAAMESNEQIVIYNDYDCDGIPAGVLLYDFFAKIGYERVANYIPHRYREGYGLNLAAMEQLVAEGAKLMITADCGITDHAEVARATELGVDVIVTDHHLPVVDPETGEQRIPPAYAVINNKRADDEYPFKELCGAGTAFKLVQAVLVRLRERNGDRGELNFAHDTRRGESATPPPSKGGGWEGVTAGDRKLDVPHVGWEKWLLDMAGLATIADMVPLTGENRAMARFGLTVLQKSPRPGLQQLCRAMRMEQRHITEDDVGFMIAPRVNAASRMGEPLAAFKMLSSKDPVEGGVLAAEMHRLNDKRKGLVATMVKEARRNAEARSQTLDRALLVLGNPDWMPGLLGLAANSLVEEYKKPVFLWGRHGAPHIKGSCRSDGTVNMVELMAHVSAGVFLDFGGHRESGGFSITHEFIHTLDDALHEAYEQIPRDAATEAVQEVDAELSLSDVTMETYRALAALAPFGMGNPKPLFLFNNITLTEVAAFGRDKAHLKLTFADTRIPTRAHAVSAIGFFQRAEQYAVPLVAGERINLVASLECSYFRRIPELRLRIVDIF